MIDNRIEKIRAEIERRLEDAKAGVRQNQNGVKFEIDNKQDLVIWQHLESMAVQLLSFIDSLQEEPVSIWHDASKKSDNPEDVVIINPSDNTGEVLTKCTGVNQGHIWAYTSELPKLDNLCNIGKNLQESQVKESAEIQHVNETCKENGDSLTQESVINVWHDANEEQPEEYRTVVVWNPTTMDGGVLTRCVEVYKERIWAYIEDLLNLSNVQRTGKNWNESVSEELEEAAIEICSEIIKGETIIIDGYEYVVLSDAEECFKAGAKWQLRKTRYEKDENNKK